jgi:carboxypeptidase Taq
MSTAYPQLEARYREAALIKTTQSMLGWDQETYLPAKAHPWRADQIAWLAGQQHRLTTGDEIGGWLAQATSEDLTPSQRTNVRGWQRDYALARELPNTLVEELTRTTAQATQIWAEARARSSFADFLPQLSKLVALAQEKADRLLPITGGTCRYDALLGEYEPGIRTAEVSAVFASFAPALAALLEPALARSATTPADALAGHYPVAAQQAFNREVATAIGFDFAAGRIDTTTHPFCTELGPYDVRQTTRYDEANFLSSLFGILHESGHGLYDQGLSKADWGLPAGEACSLGIHESQSRLWENHVGGSDAFWAHWYPRACHHFPHLKDVSAATIAAAARRVERSFIRVDADEVTYDLHIAVRFEIERDLMAGTLALADVPEAWNALFKKLTGLTVPDDAHGCLQDIHWSFAGFGYFPTYTLGNLNAAQLMAAARRAVPTLDDQLASGQYHTLLTWLRTNVHEKGRSLTAPELMTAATGQPTVAGPMLAYLEAKFC